MAAYSWTASSVTQVLPEAGPGRSVVSAVAAVPATAVGAGAGKVVVAMVVVEAEAAGVAVPAPCAASWEAGAALRRRCRRVLTVVTR